MYPRSVTVLGSILLLVSCPQRHGSDEPDGQAPIESTGHGRKQTRSEHMIEVEEVGWGFMTARLGAGGDTGRVFPIRTAAEYQAFAAELGDDGYIDLGVHFPTPPSFDAEREVLIFVEFPDGAGSELRPVVDGIERDGDVARVHAHWTTNPKGSMTDNISRNWVLIRAPRHALDDDPRLSLDLAPGVR
jgi:hypothetical protein